MARITIDPENIEFKTLMSSIEFKTANVLEIGCGDGEFSLKYCPFVSTWIGIDINDDVIAKATSKNISNAKFYKSDFLTYKSKQTFDIIIMRFAFHELSEEIMEKSLEKTMDLLNKDGKLVIIDPQFNSDFQNIYDLFTAIDGIDHNVRLMKSREVLDRFISSQKYQLKAQSQYHIPYIFADANNLITFVNQDYQFTSSKLETVTKNVFNYLTDRLSSESLKIFDEVNLFILSNLS